MRKLGLTLALSLVATSISAPVAGNGPQEKYERKGPREWKSEYENGRYVLKEERKGREYKYESKRGNRETKYEHKADGSWKEEVKVGNCTIKRERDPSGQYKSERSC